MKLHCDQPVSVWSYTVTNLSMYEVTLWPTCQCTVLNVFWRYTVTNLSVYYILLSILFLETGQNSFQFDFFIYNKQDHNPFLERVEQLSVRKHCPWIAWWCLQVFYRSLSWYWCALYCALICKAWSDMDRNHAIIIWSFATHLSSIENFHWTLHKCLQEIFDAIWKILS